MKKINNSNSKQIISDNKFDIEQYKSQRISKRSDSLLFENNVLNEIKKEGISKKIYFFKF